MTFANVVKHGLFRWCNIIRIVQSGFFRDIARMKDKF